MIPAALYVTFVAIIYVGLMVLFSLAEQWFDDDDDDNNPTPA